MKRRAFIAGFGGAAAWPVVARGQHQAMSGKIWRVGYLSVSSATDFALALFDAFKLKLHELGYVEGRNLQIDVRRAEFDYARLPILAAELISLRPDVLVGLSPPATARPAGYFVHPDSDGCDPGPNWEWLCQISRPSRRQH